MNKMGCAKVEKLILLIRGDDAEDITNKLHGPCALLLTPAQRERKNLCGVHRCGTGQIPSEDQVRIILTTLEC